jgi:hypothetical protein
VFTWNGSAMGAARGGPLFVPREQQGAGRHDAPEKYGAWYCSRDAVSAVAESMAFARGRSLHDGDFVTARGTVRAVVGLQIEDGISVLDLDDPQILVERRLRPSQVATRQRPITQRIATALFDEGATGFLWWSTLDAAWVNATLFHERALPYVSIATRPRRLSTRLPEVQEAAERIGISLAHRQSTA